MVAEDFYYLLTPFQRQRFVTMQIANAIYVNEKYAIRSSFEKLATQKFYSQVANVDMSKKVAAAKIINGWVSETTHGKITDLVAAQSIKKELAWYWLMQCISKRIGRKSSWRLEL